MLTQFPNVGFLTKQILGILASQIETKLVFSLASVDSSPTLPITSGKLRLYYHYCKIGWMIWANELHMT
jgi:hypothetical protein